MAGMLETAMSWLGLGPQDDYDDYDDYDDDVVVDVTDEASRPAVSPLRPVSDREGVADHEPSDRGRGEGHGLDRNAEAARVSRRIPGGAHGASLDRQGHSERVPGSGQAAHRVTVVVQ